MKNIHDIASMYESAALTACREAEQGGQDAPRLLSVHATAGGYVEDFIAPLHSLREVRESITSMGGAYRARLI